MKSTLEILTEARELISDPERWLQGRTAADARGVDVAPNSPKAVCWCSLGALAKVIDVNSSGLLTGHENANDALCEMANAMSVVPSVWIFNDAHTHDQVLAAWDQAIADRKLRESEE